MKIAIIEARKSAARGEVPIGAAIYDPFNRLIASAGNRNIELKDPTSHAEILAIKQACNILGQERLWDCSIYVTLEPCVMCAAAIAFARIANLYFGAYDEKFGAVKNGAKIYENKFVNFRPKIYESIEKDDCSTIIKDFFRDLRANKKIRDPQRSNL